MVRPLVVAACIAAAPAAVGAILAVPAAASPGNAQFSSNAPLENAPLQPGPDIDIDPDIDVVPNIPGNVNVPNVPNVNVPNVNLPNVPGNVNVPNVNVPNVNIADDIAADIVPDLNVVDDIVDIVPDVNLNVPNIPNVKVPERQGPEHRWRWRWPRRRWPSVTERPYPWPLGVRPADLAPPGLKTRPRPTAVSITASHPSVEPSRPAPGCAW